MIIVKKFKVHENKIKIEQNMLSEDVQQETRCVKNVVVIKQ